MISATGKEKNIFFADGRRVGIVLHYTIEVNLPDFASGEGGEYL